MTRRDLILQWRREGKSLREIAGALCLTKQRIQQIIKRPEPTRVAGVLQDLTGQRFGRLIAERQVGVTARGHAVWECRCDCGNIHVARAYNLKTGNVRSCGCLPSGWRARNSSG